MENVAIPPERIQDPPGKILGPAHSRDRCRTPMQWDASDGAGFSSVEPWLPLSPDWRERNVAAQAADARSLFNLYRQLLHYRRRHPSLMLGEYRSLETGENDVYAYASQAGDERRIVCLNFSGETRRVKLSDAKRGAVAISTHMDRTESVPLADLPLRPFEGVLLAAQG